MGTLTIHKADLPLNIWCMIECKPIPKYWHTRLPEGIMKKALNIISSVSSNVTTAMQWIQIASENIYEDVSENKPQASMTYSNSRVSSKLRWFTVRILLSLATRTHTFSSVFLGLTRTTTCSFFFSIWQWMENNIFTII